MATTKRKVGRPTKYTDAMCTKVDEYLQNCKDVIEDYHKTQGLKSDTYERLVLVNLPSIEKFARFVEVPIRTIYDWRDAHEEFSQSLAKIVEEQKHRLVDNSLGGHYNPTIAKLILSANHDVVEKKEIDHTTKGEKIEGFNYVAPDGETND